MTKPFVTLSRMEWAILDAIKTDCDTTSKIAERLQIPVPTVRDRLKIIYEKFDVKGFKMLELLLHKGVLQKNAPACVKGVNL